MRVRLSYFNMGGNEIEKVSIKAEALPEEVRFPGDVVRYVEGMRKAGNLPGREFRGIDFHIMVSVVTSEYIYNKLIINNNRR